MHIYLDNISDFAINKISLVVLLFLIALVHAAAFYVLVHRKINFKESFRVFAVANALNKILFSGSGYFAGSYFSQRPDFPFYQALAAFALLEVLSVFLWLVAASFFGAEFAIEWPLIFIFVIILVIIINWRWRSRLKPFITKIIDSGKNLGKRSFWAIPFLIVSFLLHLTYYHMLFKQFGLVADVFTIMKIVSLSFTAGYLSPAPAGLGFKETGMILLLTQNGLSLTVASSIAVLDRVLITTFWIGLALLVGFDLVKQEFRRRREGKVKKGN